MLFGFKSVWVRVSDQNRNRQRVCNSDRPARFRFTVSTLLSRPRRARSPSNPLKNSSSRVSSVSGQFASLSELNGCGEPCADVHTISSTSLPTIESDKCYVGDGTFPSSRLYVGSKVSCAKIIIPSGPESGSSVREIEAHLPRLYFAPRKRFRKVARRSRATARCSSTAPTRAFRVRWFLFAAGLINTTSRRSRPISTDETEFASAPI